MRNFSVVVGEPRSKANPYKLVEDNVGEAECLAIVGVSQRGSLVTIFVWA